MISPSWSAIARSDCSGSTHVPMNRLNRRSPSLNTGDQAGVLHDVLHAWLSLILICCKSVPQRGRARSGTALVYHHLAEMIAENDHGFHRRVASQSNIRCDLEQRRQYPEGLLRMKELNTLCIESPARAILPWCQ